MTTIAVRLQVPASDGNTAAAEGSLRFTPTARRVIAGTPNLVVLPTGFPIQLVAGAADVDLEPTAAAWLWRVDEAITGLPLRTIYVQIPDVTSIDYDELVPIDPATLEPSSTPAPAWVATQNLQLARTPEDIIVGAITLTDGAPTSSAVVWPDGTVGVFTGTPSEDFPGSLDSYTITYGDPVTRTYTQPTVTRDVDGNVTNHPAITEEPS